MPPNRAKDHSSEALPRSLASAVGLALATAGLVLAAGDRTFFLALDSVPYTSVAAFHESGAAPELFAELGPPRPLISTFPSTTTVALGAALAPLGVEISPGYEARFFDWSQRSVRGGGPISFFRIDFPWRDFFDWSKKGVARSAFASLRPVEASERRALSAFAAFLASDRRDFFAYIETTDTAAHLRGPASLETMFRLLGEAIRRARSAGERFRVVLFSDHGIAGGEPLDNVLPSVLGSLERAGFERVRRLAGGRQVVLTPYGLVSSFEAYAEAEAIAELAQVLRATPGVELCAYREGARVRVVGSSGSALIARQGDLWAYLPDSGDPLGYRKVSEELGRRRGDREAGGWFADREWFAATQNEPYPDALRRIADGFEWVDNPASVVCSLAGGSMYGPKKTERAARWTGGRLRWTHGALSWEASAGFLVTDSPAAGSGTAVRLSEALAPRVSAARELSRPRLNASRTESHAGEASDPPKGSIAAGGAAFTRNRRQ